MLASASTALARLHSSDWCAACPKRCRRVPFAGGTGRPISVRSVCPHSSAHAAVPAKILAALLPASRHTKVRAGCSAAERQTSAPGRRTAAALVNRRCARVTRARRRCQRAASAQRCRRPPCACARHTGRAHPVVCRAAGHGARTRDPAHHHPHPRV